MLERGFVSWDGQSQVQHSWDIMSIPQEELASVWFEMETRFHGKGPWNNSQHGTRRHFHLVLKNNGCLPLKKKKRLIPQDNNGFFKKLLKYLMTHHSDNTKYTHLSTHRHLSMWSNTKFIKKYLRHYEVWCVCVCYVDGWMCLLGTFGGRD